MLRNMFYRAQSYIHGEDTWPKVFAYMGTAFGACYFTFVQTRRHLHPTMGINGDEACSPPPMPWPHQRELGSLDHASLRRGYQVYREVCSTCHALSKFTFRDLVGVTHTEEQAKQLAASLEIRDGPDSTGQNFTRPGKLDDHFPAPYLNDAQAMFANGGIVPKDLRTAARQDHHRRDYVFALLTGYSEAPPGVAKIEGKYWNNYFNGGWIGMAEALSMDGLVEYEDGTEASKVQMAWDVTNFLGWTADPGRENMKMKLPVMLSALSGMALGFGYWIRSYKMRSKAQMVGFKTPIKRYPPPSSFGKKKL